MATTPPVNPQYPTQPPMGVPPPPPKKGMGPLGWVLIGCGGIVVIIFIVVLAGGLFVMHKAKQAGIDPDLMKRNPGLASAKLLIAVNPDLELTSEDDARGIVHIHDKKQNKNFILSFEDAKKGKLTLQEEGKEAVTFSSSSSGETGTFEAKTSEGSFKLGGGGPANLPSWVPSYPNSQPQTTMSGETAKEKTAQYSFKTADAPEKVVAFYKDALASSSLNVTNSATFASGSSTGGTVAASDEGKKREVLVIVGNDRGQTTVAVTYTEKK
ncbi:MAG: hypothetical protein ABSF98_27220 [Bryobacteraceae bacterium]|jgi:hypothetical protein